MPARAVEQQHRMRAPGHVSADLVEVHVHGLGVGIGQRQERPELEARKSRMILV